jgi:hypothetical protein
MLHGTKAVIFAHESQISVRMEKTSVLRLACKHIHNGSSFRMLYCCMNRLIPGLQDQDTYQETIEADHASEKHVPLKVRAHPE